MNIYPAVRVVIEKLKAKELHAARSGREVMAALTQLIAESPASEISDIFSEVEGNVDALLKVMPAYAPPINVLHRILWRVEEAQACQATLSEFKASIVKEAQDFLTWSEEARAKVADHGFGLIPEAATIFTFTLSETVLYVLLTAWAQGKRFRVRVTESRPNNDGLTTAARLSEAGIPVEISIDACLSEMISGADLMFSGAEAVLFDGSMVCKVGTYPAALVARAHGVPLYTLVDTLKFDLTSRLGLPLWMDPIETKDISLPTGSSRTQVVGHLFDWTPASLIRGIVTEKGIINPKDSTELMRNMPVSNKLNEKLYTWAYQEH